MTFDWDLDTACKCEKCKELEHKCRCINKSCPWCLTTGTWISIDLFEDHIASCHSNAENTKKIVEERSSFDLNCPETVPLDTLSPLPKDSTSACSPYCQTRFLIRVEDHSLENHMATCSQKPNPDSALVESGTYMQAGQAPGLAHRPSRVGTLSRAGNRPTSNPMIFELTVRPKIHSCRWCTSKETYPTLEALAAHELACSWAATHPDTPFKCPSCEQSFKTKKRLDHHVAELHRDV